jgi:hypothetical protein
VLIRSLSSWRASCGFTATEVTTVLTAITILSGVAAPAVNNYVEDAKLIRARSDVRTISISLVRLFSDVGVQRARESGWASYDLLVGAGLAPMTDTPAARRWGPSGSAAGVGTLDDQLVTNGAKYSPREARSQFGWRGAYLQDPVTADPWGQRYAVNVAAMKSHAFDTVTLSAGPDGIVQSPFERDGLPTIGDDIVSVVSSSGIGR